MNLWNIAKAVKARPRVTDEILYETVSQELKRDEKKDGLWLKALTQQDFDEDKAKPVYIKLRVQSLRDEASVTQVIIDELNAEADQKLRDEEAKKASEDGAFEADLKSQIEKPGTFLNVISGILQLLGLLVVIILFFIWLDP